MKVLIDQNISFRLIARIAPVFPLAEHVRSLGLTDADDSQLFQFARQNGFLAIFTQDTDFYHLILEQSPPPKVVWLRVGNCSAAFLADLILRNERLIKDFIEDDGRDCLEIYR